jgi:hypothetical protein
METLVTYLGLITFIFGMAIFLILYFTWKIWMRFVVLALIDLEILFDNIPERYATAYESGSRDGGAFKALAASYKGHGFVCVRGTELDWALRRIGDSDDLPQWTDSKGIVHAAGAYRYTPEDFYWDRRFKFIKAIFGEETGIVYMGPFPGTRPKYYELRIQNFRTVPPTEDEVTEKKASVRKYYVGEPGNLQLAGYLVAWNEVTKRVLLSDDTYPFPVDGVRIGTKIASKGDDGKSQKPQGVLANILLFVRARIREPYRYLYRVEDTLETIQNEIIQLVRELSACKSIIEMFAIRATLQADQADQENEILSRNKFGSYIRERYGFAAKGASFAFIDILGDAGKALAAPWIAQQQAEATAIQGEGEGQAERHRLILEGEGAQGLVDKFGLEGALAFRAADVADKFATSPNKGNTVVLGFQQLSDAIANFTGAAKQLSRPATAEKGKISDESKPAELKP